MICPGAVIFDGTETRQNRRMKERCTNEMKSNETEYFSKKLYIPMRLVRLDDSKQSKYKKISEKKISEKYIAKKKKNEERKTRDKKR